MAPWGVEERAVRELGFVLVARVGRGRGRCARMSFFARVGRGRGRSARRGLLLVARLGFLWPEEPIQSLLKKLLPKRFE
jgi:hypothetical protein